MADDKVRSLPPIRFWQEIFIAAVRSGKQVSEAKGIAQQALVDLQKLTGVADATRPNS